MYSTTNPAECFVFNDGNSNNQMLPWLAAMNGGGMGFGGGYNSPFWALIMLAFLRQWGFDGNGFGGKCNCQTQNQLSAIQETLNSNNGQQMLMNAITTQGNANVTATKELASAMNCNYNAVQTAINGIQSAICSLGSKNDMSAMQIVNAINSGNSALANQLSSCCCDVKTETLKMGYDNQIANLQQSQLIQQGFNQTQVGMERGISQLSYDTRDQTNALQTTANANTNAILAKLDAIEDARKDREIAALTAQLATVNSRAERQAELLPITKALSDIQAKQPNTVPIQWPQLTAVPTAQLLGLGSYSTGQWS